MASNPRLAPSNKGTTASAAARQRTAQRRQTPGAGVPQPAEGNHAGMRSRQNLVSGRQTRAQGQGGAAPVPAEKNAADRVLAKMAEAKQNRQNKGQ